MYTKKDTGREECDAVSCPTTHFQIQDLNPQKRTCENHTSRGEKLFKPLNKYRV